MRFLYVFPHPDDESFGPAAAMVRQRRAGHAVHLLTLTRGGATKVRHALGLTIEAMGAVRVREMEAMARVLDLTSLEVLDLPDGGLADVDPRAIERVVAERIARHAPEVLVSYPVHGVSGFHDHLVAHAVVKRVFCEERERPGATLRRLAMITLRRVPEGERPVRLSASPPERLGCLVPASAEDLEAQRQALACYATYRDTIARIDPMGVMGDTVAFELFGERHDPPLTDLADALP